MTTAKLSNIAEAIVQTTKEDIMSAKKKPRISSAVSAAAPLGTQKALAAPATPLPKPKHYPAIEERELSLEDAARAGRYKDSVLMRTLAYALSVKRPHEGVGERNMLGYILLNKPAGARWTFDVAGNLHIDLRTKDTHRTLFTAHVDTVHRDDGVNKIRMTPSVWYAHGSQLGADDGAGIAMLMHLMHAGVPAHYLFTLGEECGGVGSKALVDAQPRMLQRFDRAIAFDRRGTTSVISHQGWGRCCSDEFADALSLALCSDDTMYMPDDTGVYTDTAEFTDLIPECTNISIGYEREHSHEEAQDILHLQALADVVLTVQWDSLPVVRDPNEVEELPRWGLSTSTYATRTKDFDFKSFLDDEGLDAYKALCAALDGGSRREMAKSMAVAISDSIIGAPDELLSMSEKVCAKAKDLYIQDAIGDIECGEDPMYALASLFDTLHGK